MVRVLGHNPGKFTLQGTNTYLIDVGESLVLLDTGERDRPEYVRDLAAALDDTRKPVRLVVLSHWHRDHTGGLSDVLRLTGDVRVVKVPSPEHDAEMALEYIGDGATLEGLQVIHTPGHTDDSLCLWLESERLLFTGDTILGHGTPVFEALAPYMASLERLRDTLAGEYTILPAHGAPISDGPAKVREYIAHRLERERQVFESLTHGAATAEGIVERVYGDTIPRSLVPAAAHSVSLHLDKLELEGRVSRCDQQWTVIQE